MGGKAWGLARLVAAGLPVPDGFVVPTGALAQVLRADGRHEMLARARAGGPDGARAAAAVRAWLQQAPVPAAWTAAWRRAARALGGPLAVRSSGSHEDGEAASAAGVHDTVLGVSPDGVEAAIRQVWASAWSEAARAYPGGDGAGSPGAAGSAGPVPAMAVVVQRLVDAQVSGVLFSIDPVRGSWREMVVEAVWGLGEPLVDGRMVPQTFTLRRPGRPQRPGWWGRLRGRSRVRELSASEVSQETRVRWDGHGATEAVPLPERLRGARTLSPSALRRLARLGLKAEAALGHPVDLEFAVAGPAERLVVLQARPITAMGGTDRSGDRTRGEPVWTRRFVGERWHGPATPMGWSLVAPVLEHFIAYPRTQARWLGGGPALRRVDGHPYVNATVFRHLLFKAPGAAPPGFMVELLPPAEEAAARGRFAVAPDPAVLASLLAETVAERRWRRFAVNPILNPRTWHRFQARADRTLADLAAEPAGDVAARLDRVARLQALMREYVGIHVTSLLYANLCWQLLQGWLAEAVPGEHEALLQGLTSRADALATVRVDRDLAHLAQVATEDDLQRLAAGREPEEGPFAEALGRFLQRHGHRAQTSWEVFAPRWRREPARLVPLIRTAGSGDRAEAGAGADLDGAVARLTEALGPVRAAPILGLAHYTRRYMLLRENQRYWFDRLLARLQDTLLALGDDLVAAGTLDRPEEVAWLTLEELRAAAPDARDVVARRSSEHRAAAGQAPPDFLLGADAVVPAPSGPASGRLQGQGIGGGRVPGVVRVLSSPEQADRLGPGEVLVARSVDPSWTPLFRTAGAVVVELGSALSHGAVVAREYGVPMVVNLSGATRRLADGDRVTVDGARGVVWVHGAGRSSPGSPSPSSGPDGVG